MAVDMTNDAHRAPAGIYTGLATLALVGWVLAGYLWYDHATASSVVQRVAQLEAANRQLAQDRGPPRGTTVATVATSALPAASAPTTTPDELIANRDEVALQLFEAQDRLRTAQEELARATAQAREPQERLATLRDMVDAMEARLAEARGALTASEEAIRNRTEELATVDDRLKGLGAELAQSRLNIEAYQRELEARRAEYAALESRSKEAGAAYMEAVQELEAATKQFGTAGPHNEEVAATAAAPAATVLEARPEAPASAAPSAREPVNIKQVSLRTPPGETFRDCEACPEMVVLPSGTFTMGSRQLTVAERPEHRVAIARPFAMGKYEVTFEEWDACVDDGGCSFRPDDRGWGRGSRPVIGVSWQDASEYVEWLRAKSWYDYRLPSEAEWEYAARAGTRTGYWWGDNVGRGQANCTTCNSDFGGKQTAPQDAFPANPFGLVNMLGNAAEWVQDCWNPGYVMAPADGSAWQRPQCVERVLRGGAFNQDAASIQAASRNKYDPSVRYFAHGFRVARSLD